MIDLLLIFSFNFLGTDINAENAHRRVKHFKGVLLFKGLIPLLHFND